MMEIKAITEAVEGPKFCKVTAEPVVLTRETVVGTGGRA
jgi:hypothetical protein